MSKTETRRIQVCVSQERFVEAVALAHKKGLSVNTLLRMVLYTHLDRYSPSQVGISQHVKPEIEAESKIQVGGVVMDIKHTGEEGKK